MRRWAEGLFIEFYVEVVGEERIRKGSVGRRLEGKVLGEGFKAMVGEVGAFSAGEGKEISAEVGGRRLSITGAGGAQEGEVKGHIIADER